MAKFCPDQVFNVFFNYISGSANQICVCAGSPLVYSDCTSACVLSAQIITSGCFSLADDTSGRSLTMTAKTSASITNSGSAMAVALVNTTAGSVLYITTCTAQYLVAGGTVDVPSWKINLQDPT